MNAIAALWEETIHPGTAWSHVLKRGTALRITDLEGAANVGAVFYNFECPAERYNMPDTLKAQHVARLTRGCALYSDMGRILCSIVEDTVGWHDPLGGHANAEHVRRKYGTATYQEKRNDWYRNAHDNFLIELGKYGLGKRDLVANVNFFSRLDADAEGKMQFHPVNSKAGDSVDLRAEMNVLVVLNTCQHPLDPNPKYAPKPVKLTVLKTTPPGSDDFCRNFRKENQRSFILTERLFMGA